MSVKKVTSKKSPKKKIPTIFVQIASYRDPELLNTIKDCIANASDPSRLRFGIGWQHSPYDAWDTLEEFKGDKRFRILDVDYRDAKGPCWIRAEINKLYKNETYMMQLDSHHRFAKDWDITVIDMLESLRSKTCKKPLLSSYLPSFEPTNDPASRLEKPWIMEFDRFAPEGPVHFLPHIVDNHQELTSPIPHRFISGHFIFADGKFVKEVPYDETYYFHGEEINLSVRAYMAGYDLYAPHRVFMWHEYTRNGKKKHWDDHPNWAQLDKESHKHNRELLGIDNIDSHKILKNNVRSLYDYEKYAGLEFHTRKVHKLTLERKKPPVSLDDISHKNGLTQYHRMCIDIYRPIFTENDYNVWAIAFADISGKEIYREDATEPEIQRLLSVPFETDKFIHIWRNFYADTLPVSWIVWPHSRSKDWGERLTGSFNLQG